MMLSILNTPQSPNSLLHESFNNLKADEYLKGDFIYRYRAYGVGEYKNNEVKWNEAGKFLQSKELNSYVGGLEREFIPLQQESREHINKIIKTVVGGNEIPQGHYSIGLNWFN